jgi:hypothetical protein
LKIRPFETGVTARDEFVMPVMEEEMDPIKQPKSDAERARAYRLRKKQSQPLSKEQRIAIIERQISNPDISPRDLKSLSRELSLLKGESIPYDKRPVSERKPPEPEPEKLPKWWSDAWAQTFLIERMAGIQSGWSGWQFTEELTRYWKELTPEEQQELRAKAQRLRETPRNATESAGDSK